MRVLNSVDLASASPRRRDLLTSLGLDVRIVRSTYEEGPLPHAPLTLARRHAAGKLRGAPLPPGDAILIAADTVVDVDGTVLHKPRDEADARAMLALLAGRAHRVHTAFALADSAGVTVEDAVSATVVFAPLDARTIDEYAASGDGLDKAGGYAIQGLGATLVERIDGDYFTVVGFPLAAFARALPRLGRRLTYRNGVVVR